MRRTRRSTRGIRKRVPRKQSGQDLANFHQRDVLADTLPRTTSEGEVVAFHLSPFLFGQVEPAFGTVGSGVLAECRGRTVEHVRAYADRRAGWVESAGDTGPACWNVSREIHTDRRMKPESLLDACLEVIQLDALGVAHRERELPALDRFVDLGLETGVHLRMFEEVVEESAQGERGRVGPRGDDTRGCEEHVLLAVYLRTTGVLCRHELSEHIRSGFLAFAHVRIALSDPFRSAGTDDFAAWLTAQTG